MVALLSVFPSCRHADRYDYQHIKKAYDKPKKAAATLPSPVRICPLQSSEKTMKAAGSLTLEKVIRIALLNNSDMDMAFARIQQSEAMLDEAVSAFWPLIGIYGEYLQGNAPSAYLFKTIDQRKLPPGTNFRTLDLG